MKIIQYISIISIAIIGLAACGTDHSKPGSVYMPDMSYSRAYEFYSYNPNYKNGITAQAPVAGTIPRGGALPNHLLEDDTNAYKALKYGGEFSLAQIKEGGRIYNIHCGVCHGTNLDGNGPLYNGGAGKYPAAPANFKLEKYLAMPVGTMYHAIMYGKNLMGAYASQLDEKQRWAVLAYIKQQQAANGGSPLNSSFAITDGGAVADTSKAAKTSAKEMPTVASAANATNEMHSGASAGKAIVNEAAKVNPAAKQADPTTERAKKALENAKKK
jgi:mono/diheme cytochrome c family protein